MKHDDDFTAAFDEHYNVIVAYLARVVGRSAAEEIAATTFLVAYDHRDRFDPSKGTTRGWLFGIAFKLLARHRRSEGRRDAAYKRLAALEGAPRDSDEICDRLDAEAAVAAALATLTPKDFQVATLYYWTDLSYAEIASAVDIRTGTVGSTLSRVRRHVRQQLGPDFFQADDDVGES